ncbi:MAG: hypothetical protein QM762_09835 [Chryseolinea sp.]
MKALNLLVCLILAFAISSCNDDDGVPNSSNENLIVMKAFYFRHNMPDQSIVVTDPDGKVLSFTKSTYWQDTPIRPSLQGYRGKLVNLYLINRYDDRYIVSVFLNLKRGSEFIGPDYEAESADFKQSRFKLHNVDAFDSFTFSTDVVGYSLTNLADTVGRMQHAFYKGEKAFGQVVTNGQGYYNFFDISDGTEAITIDRAQMNKLSSKTTIDLGSGIEQCTYLLGASFDAESHGPGYQLFYTWSRPKFDVYYPNEPFAKYFSTIYYNDDNRSYTEQRESTAPNFKYEKIPFNFVVTNASPRYMRLDISGQFDYYVATYRSPDYKKELTIYGPHSNEEYRFPDFSSIGELDTFPLAELKTLSIEMLDFDGLEENDEHFKYFTSGHFPWPRNSKSVSFSMTLQ